MPTEEELAAQAVANGSAEEQASSAKEESELARARKEAANYRTKARDFETQLNELKPLAEQFKASQEAQKSEAQKLADQLSAANKLASDNQAAAERATRELQVTRLATKAGVDPDLVPFLDLSKLDLADEKAALEVLGKLAAARSTANGASNPGRNGGSGQSDAELRQFYFGGARSKPTIFGG